MAEDGGVGEAGEEEEGVVGHPDDNKTISTSRHTHAVTNVSCNFLDMLTNSSIRKVLIW